MENRDVVSVRSMEEARPVEQPARRVVLLARGVPPVSGLLTHFEPRFGEIKTVTSLSAALAEKDCALVIVELALLEQAERELLTRPERSFTAPLVVLVPDSARKEVYAPLFTSNGLTNFVSLGRRPQELEVTLRKLLTRDIFGLEKYFRPGVRTVTYLLASSTKREETLARVEDFASSLCIDHRLVTSTTAAAEELISNALYNAPVHPDGSPRYRHLDRRLPVQLDEGEEIAIKLCSDGDRLGISVSDPFGALSREQLLDCLARCFRGGDDQINQESAGAGLGLFLTFDAFSHFVVNIRRGSQTEMLGLIDIRGSYGQFLRSGKSFNLFTV